MEQSIDGLFDKLKYLIPLSSQNVRLTDKNNSLISIPGAICSLSQWAYIWLCITCWLD